MNTPHYKDLEVEASKPDKQRLNWRRWLLVSVLVLVLLFVALGWLGRKYIARQALSQWCSERALTCDAEIRRLGPGGAVITDVTVRSGETVPFAATEVIADLKWDGWTPSLSAVDMIGPELRGTLDDRGLRFHGLERLGGTGEGDGGTLPQVTIKDGRAWLTTSAGDIGATINLQGQFPTRGSVQIELDPVSLSGPEGTLVWTEGRLDLTAGEGELEGEAFLDLAQADVRGLQAQDLQLQALLTTPLTGAGDTVLVWDGSAKEASGWDYAITNAAASGRAILESIPTAEWSDILESVLSVSAEVQMDKISGQAFSARALQLELDVEEGPNALTGPVVMSAREVEVAQGRTEHVSFQGHFEHTSGKGTAMVGELSTTGTSLSRATLLELLDTITLPDMFAAHETAFDRALTRALSGFDATVSVDVQNSSEGWRLAATGPAQLMARSGLSVKIQPAESDHWFVQRKSGQDLSGQIQLSGDTLPDFSASLDLTMTGDGLDRVAGRDVELAPWSAGGRTYSVDLDEIVLQRRGPGELRLETKGRIDVSGNVSGFDLAPTRISGSLIAASQAEGWSLSPVNGACLSLNTQGVRFGSVSLGALKLPICPDGASFVAAGSGFAGATRLGDFSVPVSFTSNTGMLEFKNAEIDWTGGKTASVSGLADSVSLALNLGERTLSLDGNSLRLGLATRENAPPALSARLGETVFDGTLIPADVRSQDFRFDGTTGEGGIKGVLSADGVSIRDYRADPLYQPLVADFDATLTGAELYMTGPMRLANSGIAVADTLVRLDIARLTGMAGLESRNLEFEPGELQPYRLSDRLRGVFTDARGTLTASARFAIEEGDISGTGDVTVAGFGFQTTRLGRVQGVNGSVSFSDLMALTTQPGQTISVARMNPGLPLENGEIVFQLIEGTRFHVDRANFPFAGGQLALPDLTWTLGAEEQNIEVTADSIKLAELVEVLKLPETRATGTVSGRFPIDIEGTDIFVRDARLTADADGGYISYQGTAGSSAGAADPNAKMAFEALKDFEFTVLELGLDGNVRDRMTVSLILEGKSRKGIPYGDGNQVLDGQPFLFNIKVDSALGELLRNTQYYTSQKSLTDEVVRQVTAKRLEEDEGE